MRIAAIASVFLLILGVRIFFYYQNQPQFIDGQLVSFRTELHSEPKISNQQRLSANLGSRAILIYAPALPEYHYQDSLKISGKLESRLLKDGTKIFVMFFPKIEKQKSNDFLGAIFAIRQKLIAVFNKTLPLNYSALLLGITFGVKEKMTPDFLNELRLTGVLHVIAASGMNVTLFGGFISALFSFFFKRQLALFFTIFGILIYVILAGFEPSIIRAAIMGVLVFSAQILGRQRLSSYGLILAGYSMIFLNPSIVFDIGFQLSFVATAGLLYIRPIFYSSEFIKRILGKSLVGEDIATTISAQAATLPILLANFGVYSIWSIVVNALVLWTVPILMIIGGVGGVLGLFFDLGGRLVIFLSLPFILYFEKIINIFSNFGGILKIENLSWQIVLGYYLLLGAVVYRLRNSKV